MERGDFLKTGSSFRFVMTSLIKIIRTEIEQSRRKR